MPVKLGLVIARRQTTALPTIVQQVQVQTQSQAQQNGLTLRRVMNAPKTGCKSCGG